MRADMFKAKSGDGKKKKKSILMEKKSSFITLGQLYFSLYESFLLPFILQTS